MDTHHPSNAAQDTNEPDTGVWPAIRAAQNRKGKRLGQILSHHGWLDEKTLARSLDALSAGGNQHLGESLVRQGVITREQLTEALAEQFGIPKVRLAQLRIDPSVVSAIPDAVAQQLNVMPVARDGTTLVVATADPFDEQAMSTLRFMTGCAISPVLTSSQEIGQALNQHYASEAETRAVEELHFQEPPNGSGNATETDAFVKAAMGKPLVQLVNALILQAVHRGASDINIRPGKEVCTVYFRIDGRLRPVRTLAHDLLRALVARIKITSGMDIAEHRLPQDGHARVMVSGRSVDLRVSVIPTITGESVVIRVLDKARGLRPMAQLGFTAVDLERLKQLITQPHGLFLVTGPTGSGKSTTLYSILQAVKADEPHIITVEDPVEYDMEGIEQIQVHPAIGYDFAQALRHILRHDPDVVMIGEIRDAETAGMANKAALTGHLVLSTLHTNDAPGAVTRLLDIGVEPYLLSATLLGAMAQRLVALNCMKCLVEEVIPPHVREVMGVGDDEVFHTGGGCSACESTGIAGRTLAYELMTVNSDISSLISNARPVDEIRRAATANGMVSMTDHALQLARSGRIALAEAYRIRIAG